MKLFGFLCAFAVAAPALAFEDVDGSFARSMPDRENDLRKALEYSLFDGHSAKIRDVKKEGANRICGWINAKNLSGAFTGYRFFEIDLASGLFFAPDYSAAQKITPVNLQPSNSTSCYDERGRRR